jgi:hypothetical protein
MKRPFIDWKLVFNWRTYAKVKYIRTSHFGILFTLKCRINTLPLSILPGPYYHFSTGYPYDIIPQADCTVAQTCGELDARVSVVPHLVNIR